MPTKEIVGNMIIDKDRSSIIIDRAFERFVDQITESNKTDEEKDALIKLLDKVSELYYKKLSLLSNSQVKKIFVLQSRIADIFSDINDSLRDNADTFAYIRKINSKLHDNEIAVLISNHYESKGRVKV